MARLPFVVTTTSEIATGSGADKTVLQINAPTNQRVAVKSVEITFKGTDPSATPILVKLCQQTAATGSGSSASNTPAKEDPGISTSIQTTGKQGYTSEPTGTVIVRQWEVHPQAGLLYSFPLGDEVVVPGGGALGIVVNAAASVSCAPLFRCEE